MEGPSVEYTRRTSVISAHDDSPTHSAETLHGSQHPKSNDNNASPPARIKRTPTAAIVDFNGEVTQVRAHKLINRYVTKPCLQFCVHTIALAACMILGIVMMMLTDYSSPEFTWWASLFNLGLGGFLPQPTLKKA